MPGVSPKEFMKQLKEFQKTANEYLVGQTDSCIDLILKGQKQFCAVISEADDDVSNGAPAKASGQ